jgi:hypothetical protein
MQHFRSHPEFYNRPIRLTGEDPQMVITRFFQDYHLHELRQALWNWFEAAITADTVWFEEASDRCGLVILYSRLEELIEATCIIDKGIATVKFR